MKYLQKTWVRIVISLLAGGMVSEIIHITTGDPNRPIQSGESTLVLLIAAIVFALLTLVIRKSNTNF